MVKPGQLFPRFPYFQKDVLGDLLCQGRRFEIGQRLGIYFIPIFLIDRVIP